MKTDLYTKTVLTVIAFSLLIIVFKQVDIIPIAHASMPTNNLKNSVNYGLVPLNADGSIDVNIKTNESTMDVSIVDISTSDNLNVNLKEVDTYAFTYCTVPVKSR